MNVIEVVAASATLCSVIIGVVIWWDRKRTKVRLMVDSDVAPGELQRQGCGGRAVRLQVVNNCEFGVRVVQLGYTFKDRHISFDFGDLVGTVPPKDRRIQWIPCDEWEHEWTSHVTRAWIQLAHRGPKKRVYSSPFSAGWKEGVLQLERRRSRFG